MKRLQQQKGFTLVELAIVMTIIGLLIGGVLKGQALIANARVTAQISQFQAIQAANTTFQDTYNGLPGDLSTALTRIPNCTNAKFCYNGARAGTIGAVVAVPTATPIPATGTIAAPAPDTANFWIHLADAGLITGVSPAAAVAFGGDLPYAKVNNGAGLVVNDISAVFETGTYGGIYLTTTTVNTTAGMAAVTAGTQTMTPSQAAQIDRKMDDGNPTTGVVLGSGTAVNCATNPDYIESVITQDCNVSFQIQ